MDGLNRYAYCYNNPVIYTDPTGHNPHYQTGDTIHGEDGSTTVVPAFSGRPPSNDGLYDFLPSNPTDGQEARIKGDDGEEWLFVWSEEKGKWGVAWFFDYGNGNIRPNGTYFPDDISAYIAENVTNVDVAENVEDSLDGTDGNGTVDNSDDVIAATADSGGGGGNNSDLEQIIKIAGSDPNNDCLGVKRAIENQIPYDLSSLTGTVPNMYDILVALALNDPRVTNLGQGFPEDPTGASRRAQDKANKGRFIISISPRHIAFVIPDTKRTISEIMAQGPKIGAGNPGRCGVISTVYCHYNWDRKPTDTVRTHPFYFEYNIRK